MADPTTILPASPPASPPIALSVVDAARVLSLSPRTIEALAAAGTLPSFRVGRRRLFSVDALRAWVARQGEAGAP